jgi:hypothetical protein
VSAEIWALDALRKDVIHESGVDIDHPIGRLFVQALEGSEIWRSTVPTVEEVQRVATHWGLLPYRGDPA